jgi:hypothetical protein
VRREPDVGQQWIELICGLGWQATEKVWEGDGGIDGAILAGPFHWPDTERRPRCALRSEHTEARKATARRFGRSDRSAQQLAQPSLES